MEALEGYKTYIVCIIIALVAVAHFFGYIDNDAYSTILVLLGASGTAALANKVNRGQLKTLIFALFFLGYGSISYAQAATTLQWDYAASLTEVNTYTQAVVVNGTAVTTTPSCVATSATLTTCKVTSPNLNATGNNVSITATLGGVSAQTIITGLTTTNQPKNAASFKVVITTTIVLP